MKNLTRIAFALSFVLSIAACKEGQNVLDPPPCDVDPSLPECQPPLQCQTDDDCIEEDECIQESCTNNACVGFNVCDATPSADAVMFMNPNGSAFVGIEFDVSQGFADFITADQANASTPVGTCAETSFPNITGEPSPRSLGNVQLQRNGTTLADIAPTDPELFYEQVLAAGTVSLGDELDLILTGSSDVDPITLPTFLRVPPAFPVVTGTIVNNRLALGTTLTYEPNDVDHMLIRFSFVEGQSAVNITCAADPQSGSLVIDGTTFARLPLSGSFSMLAFNRAFLGIPTTDGVARSMRGTSQASANMQFDKQPAP